MDNSVIFSGMGNCFVGTNTQAPEAIEGMLLAPATPITAQMEIPLIQFRFPGVDNVKCIFSTALLGNLAFRDGMLPDEAADVRDRRRKFLSRLGLSRWAELKQVHGGALLPKAIESDVALPPSLEADGHATDEEKLGLVIKVADCQPVFLTHKTGKCIAALHVGWRGNASWFITQAVDEFCCAYDVKPCDLVAVRGPSLGPGVAQFVNFAREWGPDFSLWYDAQLRTMDLWRLTKHQLRSAGLREKSIFSLDLCTYSLPSFFFSHRQGHIGRQVGVIWKE